MSWTDLLNNRTVQNHTTGADEIKGLRKVVNRDISDASIKMLSADRRFAIAYNAVLQLSKMAIACAGYRVKSGAGHHLKTYESVKIALGTTEAENLPIILICAAANEMILIMIPPKSFRKQKRRNCLKKRLNFKH